jgi:lysozyme family protein
MTAQKPARKMRKALTFLAYTSLVLDICIAVITSVRALGLGDLQALLIPVNYALTAVVILSAVVLVTILVVKAATHERATTPNHAPDATTL